MSSRGIYVLVKVLSVHRNYAFPCCTKCSRRVRTVDDDNIFSCSECQQRYNKSEIGYRYRVNITVSDRTHISNVTIFGQCLDSFFGTSATHFKRFVDNLDVRYEDLPLPVDQIVHQCIEQCFVGSMVSLCFRGLSPCRTDSQVSRSSPTHLKNILTKMKDEETNCLPKQSHKKLHLLASHISRPEEMGRTETVYQFLKEYIDFFSCSKENISPSPGCSFGVLKSSDSQQIKSLQSKSVVNHNGLIEKMPLSHGNCLAEHFSFMVSPLALSSQKGVANIESSMTRFSTLSNGSFQEDSEFKSQTSQQNNPVLDNSPNRTALLLVSLLDMQQHELSVCINGSSYNPNISTDSKEDIDKSRPSSECHSQCGTPRDLFCFTDNTSLTENNCLGNSGETQSGQTQDLAYFNDKFTEKPKDFCDENSAEMQRLQGSEESDCQMLSSQNNQIDKDFSSAEGLSKVLSNMSLDSSDDISKILGDKSESKKRKVFPHEDHHCYNIRNDSGAFQEDFSGVGRESLQEQTDQTGFPFSEDLDNFLNDLELSNISYLYNSLPHFSTSKISSVTSSEEPSTQNIENAKDYLTNVSSENTVGIQKDSQILLQEVVEGNWGCVCELDSWQGQSFYSYEVSDSLLGKACAMNSGVTFNRSNEKIMALKSTDEKIINEIISDASPLIACSVTSVEEKLQTATCHEKDISNEKDYEKPQRNTSFSRNTETIEQNWEYFGCDAEPCYSDKQSDISMQHLSKLNATEDTPWVQEAVLARGRAPSDSEGTDDKALSLDDISVDNVSRSLGTPRLSFQSYLNENEQTSTPVLFDDLGESCDSPSGSHFKIDLSLSLPKAFHPVNLMEMEMNMNCHSTPMHNECGRNLEKLSEDFQKYSGVFNDHLERQFNSFPSDRRVSFGGSAHQKDEASREERFQQTGKMLAVKKDLLEESFVCNSDERMIEERVARRGKCYKNDISVPRETAPEESIEQFCPDTPLLFSFSSIGSNSCGELTPEIQQDSLLCVSLLECSYLN